MAMMQKSTTSSTTHYIAVLQDIVEENKREYEDDKQETRESQEKVFKRLQISKIILRKQSRKKKNLLRDTKGSMKMNKELKKTSMKLLSLLSRKWKRG